MGASQRVAYVCFSPQTYEAFLWPDWCVRDAGMEELAFGLGWGGEPAYGWVKVPVRQNPCAEIWMETVSQWTFGGSALTHPWAPCHQPCAASQWLVSLQLRRQQGHAAKTQITWHFSHLWPLMNFPSFFPNVQYSASSHAQSPKQWHSCA